MMYNTIVYNELLNRKKDTAGMRLRTTDVVIFKHTHTHRDRKHYGIKC